MVLSKSGLRLPFHPNSNSLPEGKEDYSLSHSDGSRPHIGDLHPESDDQLPGQDDLRPESIVLRSAVGRRRICQNHLGRPFASLRVTYAKKASTPKPCHSSPSAEGEESLCHWTSAGWEQRDPSPPTRGDIWEEQCELGFRCGKEAVPSFSQGRRLG